MYADHQYQHLELYVMHTRKIIKQCPKQTGILSHISLEEKMHHTIYKGDSN